MKKLQIILGRAFKSNNTKNLSIIKEINFKTIF